MLNATRTKYDAYRQWSDDRRPYEILVYFTG